MVDNQPLQQVRETTGIVVTSLHDTNQAALEVLTTMQDCNLQFAQSTFINWMELLARQLDNMQILQQRWEQQVRRQQEAFLNLMSCSMELFFTPFSFARHEMDVTKDILRREQEREKIA